jgi:hypothetical protein
VPFGPRTSNGAKFEALAEAMVFVAKSSQSHHQAFSKNPARLYVPFCRVMNSATGGFVHRSNKEVNHPSKLLSGRS